MVRDDLYQVTYKCSECGRQLTIDDTSLARIAAEFARLGWLNEARPEVAGKVDYVVTCPAYVAAEYRAEDMQHAAMEDDEYKEWKSVQDTYADFLAGTGQR